MRIVPALSALAVLSVVTSCVGPPRAPVRSPLPVRVVAPPPPAAPTVLPTDWRDWPQTPGDWRYSGDANRSSAQFVQQYAPVFASVFAITCDHQTHLVVLTSEQAPDAHMMTVRTTSLSRALPIVRTGPGPDRGRVSLSPNDPLLDAMAFSRGRFVVEEVGSPPAVLPAWAEVGRVVEDCRG